MVLASTAIALVPLARVLVARIAPRKGAFFARWGFSHVLLLMLFGLVLLQAADLVLVPLFAYDGEAGEALLGLLRTLVLMGGVSAGALLVAHRLHPEGVRALGLGGGGTGRAILAGLAALALVWPALYGCMLVWPELLRLVGVEWKDQAVLETILGLDGGALVFAVLFATLIGPLFEEIVFRGFLQPLLVQNFRETGGVTLTALLFASLHGPHPFLPLFCLSLLLGWLKLHTQRLAAPFCVHVLNNSLTLALAFTTET